ncbi:hypothetical protein HDU99_010239, partial [Rhizoclosmatium hyalinum]
MKVGCDSSVSNKTAVFVELISDLCDKFTQPAPVAVATNQTIAFSFNKTENATLLSFDYSVTDIHKNTIAGTDYQIFSKRDLDLLEQIPFTFPDCNPVTVHMKYAVCDSAIIGTNKCNGEVTGHLKTQELDPKKIPGSGFDDETCRSSIMTAAPIKSLSVFTERPINNAAIAQDLPRIAQIRTAVTTTANNKALSPFPLPATTSVATRFSSSATTFLIAAIPTTFAKAIDLVPIPPTQSPSSTLAFDKPGPTSSSGISPQIEIEQKTKSVMSTIPATKPVLTTEEQIVSDLIMSSSKSPERNFFA